jgi:hypothetical protein
MVLKPFVIQFFPDRVKIRQGITPHESVPYVFRITVTLRKTPLDVTYAQELEEKRFGQIILRNRLA